MFDEFVYTLSRIFLYLYIRPHKDIYEKCRKKSKICENFGTDLGWFGGDFGTVWGYFRDGFGPILKSRKFEGLELKN